ncbi:MAG: hypothetical protein JWR22_4215 [Herminiimonas sp.]|nr:hypothetical protein [Herminiimonas sp.]
MAQAKLWLRSASLVAIAVTVGAGLIASCVTRVQPIGMTLLFQSAGPHVGVLRFDPDGQRGPTPGSVGSMSPRGGAEMAFMPGDGQSGVPQFVDIAWMVATPEYEKDWQILERRPDKYSRNWRATLSEVDARAPHYAKRIDLRPIITPEIVARVRSNAQSTQLKLIITFNNDNVDIKAIAYQWR